MKINWRKTGKVITVVAVAVALILTLLVAPIDRTPLQQQGFYQEMMQHLDSLQLNHAKGDEVSVGWSKLSIIPDHPVPLAGYRPRPDFTGVNDSLYVRVTSIDNGKRTVFIISADLLLFPPVLKDMLVQKVTNDNYFLYFSASHTHTSVGGWDPSMLGRILMGTYDQAWMESLASQIMASLERARTTARKATIAYWERDASWYVYNRLDRQAPEDGWLRGLKVTRDDSSTAILAAFSAHPTLIARKKTLLSGDYPGALVRHLESEVNHGQFLGGMIGSHRIEGMKRSDYDFADRVGDILAHQALEADPIPLAGEANFVLGKVEVAFGPSQMRLTDNLKLRNWAFDQVVGPLEGEITILGIGNLLLLGMPCDFSGEIASAEGLQQLANNHDMELIITSFNGDYNGYITADRHYDKSRNEEVRALNWVGPYFGDYFGKIAKMLIVKVAEQHDHKNN